MWQLPATPADKRLLQVARKKLIKACPLVIYCNWKLSLFLSTSSFFLDPIFSSNSIRTISSLFPQPLQYLSLQLSPDSVHSFYPHSTDLYCASIMRFSRIPICPSLFCLQLWLKLLIHKNVVPFPHHN